MKVYTKSGCPWCVEAIDYLKKKGFSFEEIEVLSNAAAFQEMREISGQSKAPTLVTDDGLCLPDFDVDQLAEFFQKHGIKP